VTQSGHNSIHKFFCENDNCLNAYVTIHGNFTATYRIGITYTEMEIHTTKQTLAFLSYKPLFFILGHIYIMKYSGYIYAYYQGSLLCLLDATDPFLQ